MIYTMEGEYSNGVRISSMKAIFRMDYIMDKESLDFLMERHIKDLLRGICTMDMVILNLLMEKSTKVIS